MTKSNITSDCAQNQTICQKMPVVADISLLILTSLNAFLHAVGIYLLLNLRRMQTRERRELRRTRQPVYIINMSMSEMIFSILGFCKCLIRLIICDRAGNDGCDSNNAGNDMTVYIVELENGIAFVYFFAMYCITIDRLASVLFPLKYHFYFDGAKVKWLLMTPAWMTAFALSVFASLIYHFTNCNSFMFFKNLYMTIGFAFVVLVVFTYSTIFYKYVKSHQLATKSTKRRRKSSTDLFQESNFWTAVFLIFTFIIFVIVPDAISLFLNVAGKKTTAILETYLETSYALSNTADVCIYVFMQKDVRSLLREKLQGRVIEVKKLERASANGSMNRSSTSSRLPTRGDIQTPVTPV